MKACLRIMTIMLMGLCAHRSLWAAPVLLDQFPSGGSTIGLAFDTLSDTIWGYSGGTLRQQARTGGDLLNSFGAPGESANDADLDIASVTFTLGETEVPAGSLLFTNGESGVAEVYAINPINGELIETLDTAFGSSHVVGSAYSPLRNSFFLVQDSVPAASLDNLVAEIDPATGDVLNSFDLDNVAPGFSVFYGDIEVSAITGHLFIVSSAESTILELTPAGEFVREVTIPSGVSGLSGIAIDDTRNETYTLSTGGTISRLGAFPLRILGDMDGNGRVDAFDVDDFELALADKQAYIDSHPGLDPDVLGDINASGSLDAFDVAGFEVLLASGGSSVPEPSMSLVMMTAMMLFGFRRSGGRDARPNS